MRSSKNRSRSKQNNRPRTLGNIINRVFDSSGPEGKVRGTPQQIIEKYQMLSRDAQLSNDRVAAENFLQHAEHYTRLLAEATREMAAEQEARQLSQQAQQSNRERSDWRGDRDYRPEGDAETGVVAGGDGFAVVGGDDQPVVDFPDAHSQPRRDDTRRDRPRDDRPRDDRPREDRQQGDRVQSDRSQSDRNGEPRRRDDRPRTDRPREERPRDDRLRDDRPRENRPREDRREPRVIAITESTPQPELPAFITGPVVQAALFTPEVSTAAPIVLQAHEPAADAVAKPRRAPRKPKEETPSDPAA